MQHARHAKEPVVNAGACTGTRREHVEHETRQRAREFDIIAHVQSFWSGL